MRHDPVGDAEHHDAVPLAALHAVDRAEGDAALGPLAVERAPQPRLERRGVGVEVGHLQQRLEVVEVRAAGSAGAVEQRHRRAEADVVAHRGEEVAGAGALGGERRQPVEVDGQVVELLGDLHVVDAGGGLAHVGDRAAPVEPLHRPLRQPTARPAVHLGEVGAADVLRVDRDAQVGERRPHPEPRRARSRRGSSRPARPPPPAPRAAPAAATAPAPARRSRSGDAPGSASQPCTASTSARAPVSAAWVCTANAPSSVTTAGPGPDLLRHPHPVVGEQRGRRLGDRRRAAVVHLERVLGGARGSTWRSR